jgi:hypothetical protein
MFSFKILNRFTIKADFIHFCVSEFRIIARTIT